MAITVQFTMTLSLGSSLNPSMGHWYSMIRPLTSMQQGEIFRHSIYYTVEGKSEIQNIYLYILGHYTKKVDIFWTCLCAITDPRQTNTRHDKA